MPIDYTLSVTSPLTEGPRVLEAQRKLNGQNIYGQDFHQGVLDGVFGESTGRSCKRAKYWIGYATADIRATYGESLDDYLTGKKKPDEFMLNRRRLRLDEAAQGTPLRVKALKEAIRHIGVKESPAGSNNVLFSRWYGVRGPWCAMFTTYCYVRTGSLGHRKGSRWAYVPYIVADARAGRYGIQLVSQPKPGDLVCYDWDGGVADHVGLFERWVGGTDEFDAIEGNTAVGNDSNGGQVMRRRRQRRHVEAFVRVGL